MISMAGLYPLIKMYNCVFYMYDLKPNNCTEVDQLT